MRRRASVAVPELCFALLATCALSLASSEVAHAQSSFSADFRDARGNDWWVEVEVTSATSVVRVDARVDEGAWTPLSQTGWGSWAASFFVPDGSVVDFRASASGGASVLSGLYEWPSATLLQPPPPADDEGDPPAEEEPPPEEEEPPPSEGGSLSASFTGARGNEWWVEVEVSASEAITGVQARSDAGAFVTLSPTGWGSWAASFFVPAGSLVDFRATSSSGASALSGLYEWPSGTLVAPPPADDDDEPAPPPPPPPPPPTGSADVAVVIDTTAGPGGVGAPVLLDGTVLGVSIADWEIEDYRPTPQPDFLAYLDGLRPAYLRWPAGHSSQNYAFVRVAGTSGRREITADHVDDFMALVAATGAEALISINVKTQPPENAADLVRYLNVDNDYDVTWFQIGNEPDHEDGLTAGPAEHLERHLRTVAAMKAVDPTIRIVGPEIMTGAHVFGLNGTADWMTPLLEGAGDTLDAVSWHWYQLDSGQWNPNSSAYLTIDNLFQESAPDWNAASLNFAAQIMPLLDDAVAQHAPGAKIWITEYGEDPGQAAGAGMADTMAGALWAADSLGRFLRHGPGAILKWNFRQDSSALTLLDERYAPRPEYLAWWLYTNHFGDEVVEARSSNIREVNAHASWRADGRFAVVLVNKELTARTVSVELQGFVPSSAVRYVLRGSTAGYGATTALLNGQALTPALARSGVAGEPVPAGSLDIVELAPASVMLLVYQ